MSEERLSVLEPLKKTREIAPNEVSTDCKILAEKLAHLDSPNLLIIPVVRNGMIPAQFVSYMFKNRPEIFAIDPHLFRKDQRSLSPVARQKQMQIVSYLKGMVPNKTVLVIDLVFSSGSSINTVLKLLGDKGAKSVTTAAVYTFEKDSDWKPNYVVEEIEGSNDETWLSFPWE